MKNAVSAQPKRRKKTGKTVPVPTRKSVSADCPALDDQDFLPRIAPSCPKRRSFRRVKVRFCQFFSSAAPPSRRVSELKPRDGREGPRRSLDARTRASWSCTFAESSSITSRRLTQARSRARLFVLRSAGPWTGSASDLLYAVETLAGRSGVRHGGWPRGVARFAGCIRRLAPNLRSIGVAVEIVEVAYEEALLGDDRARIWIQRAIGLADAARIERAVRAVRRGREIPPYAEY